jgi:hypothetical protein
MGLTKFFPLSWILSKEMGLPYCIKTAPITWPDASHSTKNVFVKSSVAKKIFVYVASLIVFKIFGFLFSTRK